MQNITQMVDNYPEQSVIVCECALYDLETFLGHQDYIQRHEEKDNIIKVNIYILFYLVLFFYKYIEFFFIRI